MSRLPNAPVTVTLGPDGRGGLRPVSYIYKGGRYRVESVLETFAVSPPWWTDPGYLTNPAPDEVHWRVQLVGGGVVDLIQNGQEWKLYRSWD